MARRHSDHVWLWAFVDVLLVLTFVQSAFNFLALPQINPKAKDQETLPPPGTIAVLACWPPGPTDVDVWVSDPKDTKPVGYSRKSGLVWSLLRDDMGIVNDDSPINCESAFARSTPAGEYVVNIHGYSLQAPLTVHVEVALNGAFLTKADMELRAKQERTVIRFKLDGQGNLVPGSENKVFKAVRAAT
ncbi:hypothetical protein [Mesorhizobium sp. M1A.F.Ca.IN.020.04.1.1]|uniref:hypothetical protein n=1 Tax=Mesorhizobium sp. M1A.F.Ca.IN.020.04.1.1 TaxID=2496761 RepID=UPI000FCC2302|nr:hypothetical protein [Mesorhizobium sp. M1A.F.Ca.IN.020.04.1.1]RUW04065.1 hypothetical protein EOA49_00625 [Mesorhizobium sp. M1A.F.Ca.IN.020.04.1.1]RUW04128.1 hypothetical protein EOA49_00960 [Mesorhizobium sp. M1A.F.Ca.IN.020.04.1.1]